MKLIIGNKNYSSWSLRPWLALKAFGIPFEEVQLELFTENFYSELTKHSTVGKVPVLVDGDTKVWDSLAICEYLNEVHLNYQGWPENQQQRTQARALVAEMHSGLFAVRGEMPMNCRSKKKITLSENAEKEVLWIDNTWQALRKQHTNQGDFLFGQFSLVDAFFAPVVCRFNTYGISVSSESQTYIQTLLSHQAMQEWLRGSEAESTVIEVAEVGENLS